MKEVSQATAGVTTGVLMYSVALNDCENDTPSCGKLKAAKDMSEEAATPTSLRFLAVLKNPSVAKNPENISRIAPSLPVGTTVPCSGIVRRYNVPPVMAPSMKMNPPVIP